MGKIVVLILLIVLVAVGLFYVFKNSISENVVNPLSPEQKIFEKPLARYSFERLRQAKIAPSKIALGDEVKREAGFVSRMFYFEDNGKRVSGLLNLPEEEGDYPVIVMSRGYVEKDAFTSGEGTRRTAEEFARNGFITLAPDFLGFGESDMPSKRPIEDRFQTYTTLLSLLASLPTLNDALIKNPETLQRADPSKTGLWGHSNGGHITLAILAITGKSYPTVLWAPVSKPFPYSILYYTDEFEDNGKALRKVVADFEREYDIDKYSVTNYFKWINAPIELHQGAADEEVPLRWSDELDEILQEQGIAVTYFTYPGENHNFNSGGWQQAVTRSMDFYQEQFVASSSAAQLQ